MKTHEFMYFFYNGLKTQLVSIPNGMIGSVFIASLWQNDSGVLNLSGIADCLYCLFNASNTNRNIL